MTGGKARLRKSPHFHLVMMVSACALLAGCETSGQTAASAKQTRQMTGTPRLAQPGNAVAQIELPNLPVETLYPVTVALEPAVNPVLAAEAVDPAMVPTVVPLPHPSPMTAIASAAPSAAPVDPLSSAVAQTNIPASPLAVKGDRPGAQPVNVASLNTAQTSIMMADDIAPQNVLPQARPGTALGYAAPGNANAALAAINSTAASRMDPTGADRDKIDQMISRYSAQYGVPEKLVQRVVHRESRYNPKAFNRGHFGLMQIKYATARSMGYDGPASGLFDAETNLKYAIKYLRGAYLVADTDHDDAVRFYARGYYYDAKRKGLLSALK